MPRTCEANFIVDILTFSVLFLQKSNSNEDKKIEGTENRDKLKNIGT